MGIESQVGFHHRFVADMLEVTVGTAAGPAVEVTTDGCLQGACRGCWLRDWRGLLEAAPKVLGEGMVVEDEKG